MFAARTRCCLLCLGGWWARCVGFHRLCVTVAVDPVLFRHIDCPVAPMKIAVVASECVPFSKTGGLADVVGALPGALASLGHEVSVFLPKYRQTKLIEPKTIIQSITVPFDDRYRFCSVLD